MFVMIEKPKPPRTLWAWYQCPRCYKYFRSHRQEPGYTGLGHITPSCPCGQEVSGENVVGSLERFLAYRMARIFLRLAAGICLLRPCGTLPRRPPRPAPSPKPLIAPRDQKRICECQKPAPRKEEKIRTCDAPSDVPKTATASWEPKLNDWVVDTRDGGVGQVRCWGSGKIVYDGRCALTKASGDKRMNAPALEEVRPITAAEFAAYEQAQNTLEKPRELWETKCRLDTNTGICDGLKVGSEIEMLCGPSCADHNRIHMCKSRVTGKTVKIRRVCNDTVFFEMPHDIGHCHLRDWRWPNGVRPEEPTKNEEPLKDGETALVNCEACHLSDESYCKCYHGEKVVVKHGYNSRSLGFVRPDGSKEWTSCFSQCLTRVPEPPERKTEKWNPEEGVWAVDKRDNEIVKILGPPTSGSSAHIRGLGTNDMSEWDVPIDVLRPMTLADVKTAEQSGQFFGKRAKTKDGTSGPIIAFEPDTPEGQEWGPWVIFWDENRELRKWCTATDPQAHNYLILEEPEDESHQADEPQSPEEKEWCPEKGEWVYIEGSFHGPAECLIPSGALGPTGRALYRFANHAQGWGLTKPELSFYGKYGPTLEIGNRYARPLRLSEVKTPEQAEQFFGKGVKFTAGVHGGNFESGTGVLTGFNEEQYNGLFWLISGRWNREAGALTLLEDT